MQWFKRLGGTVLLLVLAGSVAHAQSTPTQVALPIDGFFERQTVKTFGTLVTPEFLAARPSDFRLDNGYPKFYGYHAAADVEYTAPNEQTQAAAVRAVVDGEVAFVGTVTGYGGVVVLRHTQPEPVTSLYGHIKPGSVSVQVSDRVAAGQQIAVLGDGFSAETAGERKHLHFGVHRGPNVALAGHEPSEAALRAVWENPNDWLRRYLPASPSPEASPPAAAAKQKPWWQRALDWLAGLF